MDTYLAGGTEMSRPIYWVDIPDPTTIGSDNATYVNVGTFHTRKEAIEFCQKEFGASKSGRVQLITRGEE